MPQNQPQKKARMTFEQRTRRRNQVLILVFSAFLIISMLISLVKF